MQKENPQVSIKKMQKLAEKEKSEQLFFKGKMDGGLWIHLREEEEPLSFSFKLGKGYFNCSISAQESGGYQLVLHGVLGTIPFTIEDNQKRAEALALKVKDHQPKNGEITLQNNKYFVLKATHEIDSRDCALNILSSVAEHLYSELETYRAYFRVSLSVDNYDRSRVH